MNLTRRAEWFHPARSSETSSSRQNSRPAVITLHHPQNDQIKPPSAKQHPGVAGFPVKWFIEQLVAESSGV